MNDHPGFTDDLTARTAASVPLNMVPPDPIMLDLPKNAPINIAAGRLDLGWNPERIRTRRRGVFRQGWIGFGLAGFIISWLGISLTDFVMDQFVRSKALGWAVVVLFVVSGSLIGFGLYREIKAWRSLHQVDRLRDMLGKQDARIEDLRSEVRRWLQTMSSSPHNLGDTIEAIDKATSRADVIDVLQKQVTTPMRQAAQQAGTRAAARASALVAVISSPAAEGTIAGLSSLLLVRQVARIYGIRPGFFATIMLLQRIAWTVASVAGTDLLVRKGIDVLHKLPYVKDLISLFPEAGLTALRLYSLASATAAACSPTDANS